MSKLATLTLLAGIALPLSATAGEEVSVQAAS